jgi:hypothetical protein
MLQKMTLTLSQPQIRAQTSGDKNLLFRVAAARYRQARFQAWMGSIRALLMRKDHRLMHLSSLEADVQLSGRRYAGLRSVPISQIRGSESRSDDFDADFRPVKVHNRWRWVSLAAARLRGAVLPPMELIQIGDVYFVRDGHHRISVARAFGQEHIDAEVTVWDLAGSPPWEPKSPASQMAYQVA